jgi:mono/diheme cytochrome c family protein
MRRLAGYMAAFTLALPAGESIAADGKVLFAEHCAACHGPEGQGTAGVAPQLVSPVIKAAIAADQREYVPLVVLTGLAGRLAVEGKTFVSAMPPQSTLSDEEIAALSNHVLGDLNGEVKAANLIAGDIAKLREAPTQIANLIKLRQGFAP